MKYYTWTVRTLSPVHIGSGSTLTKLDYAYSSESRRIYVMKPKSLFQALLQRGVLDEFEQCVSSGRRTFSLTQFFKNNNITEQEYATWAQYSYPVQNISVDSGQSEIHTFMKDAYGCPYVPGSSLKGAIRTAIAYKEICDDHGRFSKERSNVEDAVRSGKYVPKWAASQAETKVFHTVQRRENKKGRTPEERWKDILNDCMAGLRISDSKPLTTEMLALCEKVDLSLGGMDHSINLVRECLKPGTVLQFDVTVDEELFPWSMEDVIKHLQAAFESYNALFRYQFVEKALDPFHMPEDPKDGAYVYLGGGTGYLNKTFLYAMYEDSADAAEIVSLMLAKSFKRHGHKEFTEKTHISPKMFKCTRYLEQLYEMGLCSMEFSEK